MPDSRRTTAWKRRKTTSDKGGSRWRSASTAATTPRATAPSALRRGPFGGRGLRRRHDVERVFRSQDLVDIEQQDELRARLGHARETARAHAGMAKSGPKFVL